MARLQLVKEQISEIERARLQRLRQPPADAAQTQIALLARVFGLGIETADVMVHELVVRNLRDRRAVARYGGITGAPDESGARRREKGLPRAGNARVRRIMCSWLGDFCGSRSRAPWSNGSTHVLPMVAWRPARR